MKTYNITNRTSAKARATIEKYISMHEKHRASFYSRPNGSASGRRANEALFAKSYPPIKFVKGDVEIVVFPEYRETCGNVYYSLGCTVKAGGKNPAAGTVRNLRNLLQRIS